MRGEPIESVKVGLEMLSGSLRQDPYSLETVHLCVMTFDRDVRVVTPLTPLEAFQVPDIEVPSSGPTHLGLALERLCEEVDASVRRSSDDSRGDWRPILFVMTDGAVSDLMAYEEAIPEVKKRDFASIVACAAGPKAKRAQLELLTDKVVVLETMDTAGFAAFFKWVSASITSGSASAGLSDDDLDIPPPPPELGGDTVL
jgi:uncharacterized protein YegL